MDILFNMLLALLPVVSVGLLVCVVFVAGMWIAHIIGYDTKSVPSPTIFKVIGVLVIAGSVFKLVTSPLVVPANDVHDKHVEVQALKAKAKVDMKAPVLESRGFKAEDEFKDDTLEYDEAIKAQLKDKSKSE